MGRGTDVLCFVKLFNISEIHIQLTVFVFSFFFNLYSCNNGYLILYHNFIVLEFLSNLLHSRHLQGCASGHGFCVRAGLQ